MVGCLRTLYWIALHRHENDTGFCFCSYTGCHMPLIHLRHGRQFCLGYCSDMRTEVAGNIAHLSLYPRHSCKVDSSSTSQACRRYSSATVKLCDGSSCRRRMFSFVRKVAQLVPAATSQIHRRHMRTRLKNGDFPEISVKERSCAWRQRC